MFLCCCIFLHIPHISFSLLFLIGQTSNFESAQFEFFARLPVIVEDYIKDHGGFYTSKYPAHTRILSHILHERKKRKNYPRKEGVRSLFFIYFTHL